MDEWMCLQTHPSITTIRRRQTTTTAARADDENDERSTRTEGVPRVPRGTNVQEVRRQTTGENARESSSSSSAARDEALDAFFNQTNLGVGVASGV